MTTLQTLSHSTISQTTFRRETWDEFLLDAEEIFPIHWKELAVSQDRITLDIDKPRYKAMEDAGMLYILTARCEGKLVGYMMSFLMPHFHYKSSGNMALTDMYFVLPEHRNGTGARLFIEWEKKMRELGIVNLITSCKVHEDHSRLFDMLGFKFTDKTFQKVLCR